MRKSSFTKKELLACGHGELFGPENGRLPLPDLLLMDRIVDISAMGGSRRKGRVVAELDIRPDLWFLLVIFRATR